MTNDGIGNSPSISPISAYSSGRPQSARSPVAMTQSGAGSSAAIASTALCNIAFVSMPPYASTPRGRTWKSVICAMIIRLRRAVPTDSRALPGTASGWGLHTEVTSFLHQRRRLLHETLVPGLRVDVAAHDRRDDLALGAPDAHRVAPRIALPGHRAVDLQRHRVEVRILVVERPEKLGSGRAQVRRQVAGRLDDDLLRFGSGDELQEFPRRLLLLRIARRDDRRVAAGRKPALGLVVDRKDGGAQRELVADQVGDLSKPRGRVEEDADLAGDELLPRLIPIDQRHAVLACESAEALEHLDAEIGTAERNLLAVNDYAAGLRDHRVIEPDVRPAVHVVREARDVGIAVLDLFRERHDAVPRVRHVVRIAARFLHELDVVVHDRRRRIERQPVQLAVDLAQGDDPVRVILLAEFLAFLGEQRIEIDDLVALAERMHELGQQVEARVVG